ncbi:MAG TPA: BON domain-containing protein [Burkholderiales bacterium]|nr:BON domain-containing protein [Burkholderiales bacterium]
MSDLDVREGVRSALDWSPKIDASRIAVSVDHGAVSLTGQVGGYLEKWDAERIAKQVYGVTGVANDLQVDYDSNGAATAIRDSDLLQRVLQSLKWSFEVPSGAVKPVVSDGWVTLSGKVKWNFQREAAESTVRNLSGVKGVTDEITLEPQPTPKDVDKRISDALSRNAQLDARRITVSTDGGTAVLDGSVSSWAERDEAETAAWSAPGVNMVKNNLQVNY